MSTKTGIEKWARTTRISGAVVKFDPRPTSAVDETRDYEKNLKRSEAFMRNSKRIERLNAEKNKGKKAA